MKVTTGYEAICKLRCEWCAKGIRTMRNPATGAPQHVTHVDVDPAGNTYECDDCTAPTRDQLIEELLADKARLEETLRVAPSRVAE